MTEQQRFETGGAATGVAALSQSQLLGKPLFGTLVISAPHIAAWREWIADIDWAPDLARDVGTRIWWRGLATLIMLCAIMLASWPGITPLAAQTRPMRAADWELARAQTITPLAWGADTGRRMAQTDVVQPLAVAPERPRIELAATLGQGDSFARVLERAGVGGPEARQITGMVGGAVTLASIVPGTRLDIVLGRRATRSEPRPVESLSFRAALDLRLEFARNANALRMDRIRIAVDDTPLRIRGRVGDSLYLAARAAGAPPTAVQSYLRVIAGQLSVSRDVRSDDMFDIIVAHRRAETGETEVGDLLYAGLTRGTQPRLRMLPWKVDGRNQWYEASGVGQQRNGLSWPVQGRITSGFGMRRHPILGYARMHAGVDFGAAYGTPIFAVTDATVTYAGYHGGHGRFVRLDHGGNIGSGYGHMSRIAVNVGQRVRRGQIIGYVGSSGLSTGAHLHYEVYRGGAPVNPMTVRFASRAVLEGPALVAFRERLAQLTALQPGTRRVASPAAVPARSGAAAQPFREPADAVFTPR